jgi:hypothetical protein
MKLRAILLTLIVACYAGSVFSAPKAYRVTYVDSTAKKERIRGIYINSGVAVSTRKLHALTKKALAVGINTYIMNYVPRSPRYRKNVKWVESQGVQYIPRIVMYPLGGTHAQLTSRKYFEKRMARINAAIDLGAKEVQLDYIRYSYKNKPSPNNAKVVAGILEEIKQRVHKRGVQLQVDIFGIAAHRPSVRIGQDVGLMAHHVDAICPMVYPSHYEPYKVHSENPYRTITESLDALAVQLQGHGGRVRVYPYIEAYNYRYPMNKKQKIEYIREQLRAARESNANGWMVWSAKNAYSNLFAALR